MLADTDENVRDFGARDLRDALSAFATGVTIITARDRSGSPIGMTASSFNSVSMDPPLVLWSVTKSALSAPEFEQAKHFAVHILATDQMDLSSRFSMSGTDKFGEIEFHSDDNNVPVIPGCATRFDCSTWAVYEGGDHWIIVGEVLAIDRQKKEGLVFGGGTYAIASPITSMEKGASDSQSDFAAPLEDMLFYHLSRAYHQMAQEFHEAVRDSGLTLAEWRLSACLYGGATLPLEDLAARTFLDFKSLQDIMALLQEQGLCTISSKEGRLFATGTSSATQRIKHLFELSQKIEAIALDGADQKERSNLVGLLNRIVDNTVDKNLLD